jgi:hypothetical protein
MIDIVFAVIAAGMNSAGGGASAAPDVATDPAAEVAPLDSTTATAEAPKAETPVISSPTVSIGENVNLGSGVVIGGAALLEGTANEEQPTAPAPAAAPATNTFNMTVVPAGLVADPQTPTGKFTTAVEVKPILNATKGNWVAVREYNGSDLLYVTHLWGWRCGLSAMAISVNNEPMQNWPLPPCHMKYTTPNAILEEDGQPYLKMRLGAVETIEIQIVYDDLSMDSARFERGNVLIP